MKEREDNFLPPWIGRKWRGGKWGRRDIDKKRKGRKLWKGEAVMIERDIWRR